MDIRAERRAAGVSQAELARAAEVPQPNISAYENGRRQPSPEVLERIRRALAGTLRDRLFRHRDEIHRLVVQYHATDPRVFGSVARDQATESSDVDLLVDFTADAGLLDEIGLRLALADLLQAEVDVVASDTLRGELRDRILREAVPV
ncbi:helix-turn-helix domain-containing protein [Microbacterium sp. KSW2-29]|uniref:Helix-turn-helix domain-containing protein n=1 Tax=Microbacterium phycohabitans TaxID=3075993 RepID=A0ABU3SKQ3_9MICO|nr:helix-turn-helix domain-containing protein [Microbacterium sp. KSW2-29]MDU0345397.1 helix-turn-helix domain-containing protein [Microbacterium sp. KSW2-29]